MLAAQDWRDHDDADPLRDDPAFQLAVSSASTRTPLNRAHGLASPPMLSRFTAIMTEPSNRSVLRKAALELGAGGARTESGREAVPRRNLLKGPVSGVNQTSTAIEVWLLSRSIPCKECYVHVQGRKKGDGDGQARRKNH